MASVHAAGTSPFDGYWPTTTRKHTDGCGYSATTSITFTTNAAGVTTPTCAALGVTTGSKVVGRTLSIKYSIVNGVASGRLYLTLSADGRSFTGTFTDKTGHKGTWNGKRELKTSTSPFDGYWPTTTRQHTDGCRYSATTSITFTTDAAGVTTPTSEGLGVTTGSKVVGRTLSIKYGIVNGVASGQLNLTLSADGRSFTGTFTDKTGHKGTWNGKRELTTGSSLFDGFWPTATRQHTDGCGYSATTSITFTTDAAGVTTPTCEALGVTKGSKVVGRTLSIEYGFVNGVAPGRLNLTLSADGTSFTGTFTDTTGHKGTWNGKRELTTGSSLFDGFWPTATRQHTDGCGYSATTSITFTTDAAGVTTPTCEALGVTKGSKVVGHTLSIEYGFVNGVAPGRLNLTLSADGRSFTGTFTDTTGHKGTWNGKR